LTFDLIADTYAEYLRIHLAQSIHRKGAENAKKIFFQLLPLRSLRLCGDKKSLNLGQKKFPQNPGSDRPFRLGLGVHLFSP
jgi:hypothetical protein